MATLAIGSTGLGRGVRGLIGSALGQKIKPVMSSRATQAASHKLLLEPDLAVELEIAAGAAIAGVSRIFAASGFEAVTGVAGLITAGVGIKVAGILALSSIGACNSVAAAGDVMLLARRSCCGISPTRTRDFFASSAALIAALRSALVGRGLLAGVLAGWLGTVSACAPK